MCVTSAAALVVLKMKKQTALGDIAKCAALGLNATEGELEMRAIRRHHIKRLTDKRKRLRKLHKYTGQERKYPHRPAGERGSARGN